MSQPVAEQQLGFTCAACGKQFRWKPELAGKSVKCKCETTIRVPDTAGGVAQPKSARTASAPAGTGHASAPPPPFAAGVSGAARAAEVPPRAPPAQPPKRSASKPVTTPNAPAKPAAKQAGRTPPPPPPPAARADEDDGGLAGLYALADQEAASADQAAEFDESTHCPNCRGLLAPEAVLCTSCGYDRRKGKVLSTAAVVDKPKRGLFGLGKPKKEDPNKKKVVDKMAPQGSFVVGLLASAAFAAAASLLWFGVAYAVGWDVYFLVALVGAAAGIGMQVGQKGYSTLGGLGAVCVTLLVVLAARVALVIVILLPLLKEQMAIEAGDNDLYAAQILTEQEYANRGLDPENTTPAQDDEIQTAARARAATLSDADKTQLIADAEGADAAAMAGPDADVSAGEVVGAGFGVILQLVVFGGVKSFLFLLAALGLAFRTANGGVSG
jgi:hypothetical protein